MSVLCDIAGVTCSFGGLVALDGTTFKIEAGRIHGLIGPNGAGKSTLLNVLTGIYRPNAGAVTFNGEDLLALRPHQLAGLGVARTFQDVQLFSNQTVIENVVTAQHARLGSGVISSALRFPAQRREERAALAEAMRWVEFFGLGQWAERRSGDLSFGWQRRLSLARAMATQPKFLLLDEPTAGMNMTIASEMGELIRKVAATGVTVLLIEHNMPLVMGLCEHVTVLDQGRVIAEGPPAAIQADPRVVTAYLGERRSRAAAARG
jgi:ABC-type branched-subunit amino acid transport system ATPase component